MTAAAKALRPLAAPARWLLSLPAALVGPIFTKELRVASRRRRNYVLRACYLVALLLFILLVWQAAASWDGSGSYGQRVAAQARAGRTIASCIVWFQFCAVQLLAVVMLSTSVSEEVYRRTLGVLLTTPIVSFQVVAGKLLSKLLQLLVLVAVSLPLLAVVRVFGGVPWQFVVAGTCLTLTAALFAASVSMFFSILFRHAFVSILLTLGVGLVLYAIIPTLIGLIVAVGHLYRSQGLVVAMMSVLLHGHPFYTLVVVTMELMEPRAAGMMGMGALGFYWWVNCLVMLGLTCGVLAACVGLVRRATLRQACGGAPLAASRATPAQAASLCEPQARHSSLAPARPPRIRSISTSPVLWKELRATAIRSRLVKWLIIGLGALVLLLLYALVALLEDGFAHSSHHAAFVVVMTVIAAVVTAVYAAVNVTSEKEAGTWDILLATPLSDWEILGGKAVGCLRRSLPIWLLPLGHAALFIVLGGLGKLAGFREPFRVHPVVPLHLTLVAVSVLALFTGSGLLFGTLFKRTTTAVILNLALGLALWLAVPAGLALLGEGFSGGLRDDVRSVAEHALDANPVVQAFVVTERASGSGNANASLGSLVYRWPGADSLDAGVTTAYLLLFAALYLAAGAGMAALARLTLRRRAA